jgi:hypothetical protein
MLSNHQCLVSVHELQFTISGMSLTEAAFAAADSDPKMIQPS